MKPFKNLQERISTRDEAYWVSPRGKIMSVEGKHIDIVIKEPSAFGYRLEDIEKLYNQFGEQLGTEGKAREKIFLDLFKKGWMRIRKYMRPYRWTLNVNKLDSKTKDHIKFFADKMLKNGYSKYDEVLIDSPVKSDIYTFQQLSEDILYLKENLTIPEKRSKLVEVTTFMEE